MVALGEMIFLGSEECVEFYSTNTTKTAFVDRFEQEVFLHYCLTTDVARTAMDRLHWGSLSEKVEVDISEMELEMVRYVDRSLVSWAAARRAVLVRVVFNECLPTKHRCGSIDFENYSKDWIFRCKYKGSCML